MTAQTEVAAAREDVVRTRARISDTISEIETRITAPVHAVKERLDVVQLVRDHPWPALAAAVGIGALVSASGADAKSLRAARVTAVDAGSVAARTTRALPGQARGVAQRAAHAAGAHVSGLAGSLVLAFIDRLREPAATPPSPTPPA